MPTNRLREYLRRGDNREEASALRAGAILHALAVLHGALGSRQRNPVDDVTQAPFALLTIQEKRICKSHAMTESCACDALHVLRKDVHAASDHCFRARACENGKGGSWACPIFETPFERTVARRAYERDHILHQARRTVYRASGASPARSEPSSAAPAMSAFR